MYFFDSKMPGRRSCGEIGSPSRREDWTTYTVGRIELLTPPGDCTGTSTQGKVLTVRFAKTFMLDSVDAPRLARNLAVYLLGTGAAIAGALGLSGAIALSSVLSAVLLIAGLGTVVFVHEYLDGPF